MAKIINFFKQLGPGLMWAGAAIGVSHLIQSTRAGAEYGFALLGVLIFSNVIKYPFFEFAPRYTAATGRNLIDGYNRIGRWAVALFFVFTLLTMFVILAAVTIVTSGLIAYVFNLSMPLPYLSLLILVALNVPVLFGKYKSIDSLMKWIILLLSVSTFVAVYFGLKQFSFETYQAISFEELTSPLSIVFLIAFVGWMPAPIDISVWHSFWAEAKSKESETPINFKSALFDFKVGYFGTAILAICFFTLGATLMYHTGGHFSGKGTVFSKQLITLYTQSIGQWSFYLIAIAAILTMVSTTLTSLDAYNRILRSSVSYLSKKNTHSLKYTIVFSVLLVSGTFFIINSLAKNMTFMVDFATTLSFVLAPIMAFLNYKIVNSQEVPQQYQPSVWLNVYAKIGLLFLTLFSFVFIYWRFL